MNITKLPIARKLLVVSQAQYDEGPSTKMLMPVPQPRLITEGDKKQHINWIFTLNNWQPQDVLALRANLENGTFTYLCFGFETCPTTNTPHLQGYFELKCRKYRKAVKRIPGCFSMHLEARGGSKLDAVSYCGKEWGKLVWMHALNKEMNEILDSLKINKDESDEDFAERKKLAKAPYDAKILNFNETHLLKWLRTKKNLKSWLLINDLDTRLLNQRDLYFFTGGNILYGLTPGKRTDIDICRELVNQGVPLREIAQVATSKQGLDFAKAMLTLKPIHNRSPPVVIWIHGPSGSGKSRLAHKIAEGNVWTGKRGFQWFCGYDGQETVIFDEFRGSQVKYDFLLQLLDRYALSVPTKGGQTEWKPKMIIITSVFTPQETIDPDQNDPDYEQLLRRISRIVCLKRTGSAPKTILDPDGQRILDRISAELDIVDTVPETAPHTDVLNASTNQISANASNIALPEQLE